MIEHPYASFLAKLDRPGRYLGGEYGEAPVPDGVELRLALGFPDSYEIGMSHIGLSVLYEIVNAMTGVYAERVFMPWPDLEAQLVEHKVPLVSLETGTPLCEFDLLGFSMQYELNYTNLLAMLSLGGVPRRSTNRGADDPIVLIGGPIAMHAEPLSPFVDLCLIGDGEEALPELLEVLKRAKKAGMGRVAIIEELHGLPSVFAPGLLERFEDPVSGRVVVKRGQEPVAVRAAISSLGNHPPGRGPVPTVGAVFDRYSFEIARGCTAGCRFCQAGFLYRPVRERDLLETGDAVERAVSCLGYDDVSLAALSTADHSQIGPIISTLGERYTPRRVSLAVPSLRAYGLRDELVEVLGRLRATGVTLAPEAGSQRMRDVVNKNVTREDLTAAAARFFDQGFTRIKLYFMLGLPGETDEDLLAIVDLASLLRDFGRKRLGGRTPIITISISTFVPKPFTPFERETMIDSDEVRRRQELVARAGKANKFEVRLHSPKLSGLEGVLSRGDSSLAPLLERAADLGARFDGWDDMFNDAVWSSLLREVDMARALGEIPDGGRLPWDHLDVGVEPGFLLKERDRARKAETLAPCGRFSVEGQEKPLVICHGCGLACKPSSLPVRDPRVESTIQPPRPRSAMRGKPRPKALVQEGMNHQVRIRLFLSKWGRQIYVGHLDTMRQVMRSLRRAGLEVVYTQGFHPKPKIQSAPPLPLGIGSLAEPIDLFLLAPPPEERILERLNRVVPADMSFRCAHRLTEGDKSLAKSIGAAQYVALLSIPRLEASGRLNDLLAQPAMEVARSRKGQTKTVDIRPYIVEAAVQEVLDVDFRVPVPSGRTPVAITLSLPPSGGARIGEVLEWAFGPAAKEAWVVRKGFVFE